MELKKLFGRPTKKVPDFPILEMERGRQDLERAIQERPQRLRLAIEIATGKATVMEKVNFLPQLPSCGVLGEGVVRLEGDQKTIAFIFERGKPFVHDGEEITFSIEDDPPAVAVFFQDKAGLRVDVALLDVPDPAHEYPITRWTGHSLADRTDGPYNFLK